jgi:hypothetical protein
MATRRLCAAFLFAAGLAAAAPASAQFVAFSRCHGAYPCNQPFGLQYNPDPLIAGPYASGPTSAVAGHIELKKIPEVKLDTRPQEPPVDDAVTASVRAFLKRHPALKRPEEKAGEQALPAQATPTAPAPDPKP